MSENPSLPGPNAPQEPLLTVGAITAAVTTLLALGVSFGLRVSDDQQAAILGVIAVTAPIVVAWVGRCKVWGPASVHQAVARAIAAKPRSTGVSTGSTVMRDPLG